MQNTVKRMQLTHLAAKTLLLSLAFGALLPAPSASAAQKLEVTDIHSASCSSGRSSHSLHTGLTLPIPTGFSTRLATPQDAAMLRETLKEWRINALSLQRAHHKELGELRAKREQEGRYFLEPHNAEAHARWKKLHTLNAHLEATRWLSKILSEEIERTIAPHHRSRACSPVDFQNYTLLYHDGKLVAVLVMNRDIGEIDVIVADPENLNPDHATPVRGIAEKLLREAIRQHSEIHTDKQTGKWHKPLSLQAGTSKVKSIYYRYFFDVVKQGKVVEREPSQKDARGHSIKTEYHKNNYMELSQANAERFLRGERRQKPEGAPCQATPQLSE